MNRSRAGRALALAGVVVGAILLPQSAFADDGFSVGTCVVADKLHPGRVVQVLPYGYVVKGFGPSDSPMTWPSADVVPGPCADADPAAIGNGASAGDANAVDDGVSVEGTNAVDGGADGQCYADDVPTGDGLDGAVRATLVRGFSHQPPPGEDGRITVHLLSVRTGASRQASPVDEVQYQTAPGATIYDVRASFETCTDYSRRLVFTTRERNFVCFTKASSVFDCSMTANSPGLAQDVAREVRK